MTIDKLEKVLEQRYGLTLYGTGRADYDKENGRSYYAVYSDEDNLKSVMVYYYDDTRPRDNAGIVWGIETDGFEVKEAEEIEKLQNSNQ